MKSKAKNSKLPRKSSNGTSQKQNNPGMDNAMKAIQSTLQDESQSGTGARAKHQSLNSKSNKALHYNCQNRRETLSPTPNPTSNGHEYPRFDPKPLITSMETEYIEALYSDLSGRNLHDSVYNGHSDFDLPPHSSSESDDIGYEDMESYEGDQGEEGDCKDFDDDLDVYKHDDFLSSQEAILMELRREQVEFEENVRQLQQQLQRQGSLHPLTSNDGGECKDISQGDVYSNKIGTTGKNNNDLENDARSVKVDDSIATKIHAGSMRPCSFCIDPKSSLCLEKYGSFWRPVIIEAMATAAAAIANFNARQYNESQGKDSVAFQYNEFLPKAKQSLAYPIIDLEQQDLHHLSQCSKAIDGDSVLLNSLKLKAIDLTPNALLL
ncbi:hypothetical protein BGX27_004772 [Mortierella sp. AM989]|nr:hypothetical protein BGX27_004772 [Mortierella sp. AM989]